jgi:hypothetical protein
VQATLLWKLLWHQPLLVVLRGLLVLVLVLAVWRGHRSAA